VRRFAPALAAGSLLFGATNALAQTAVEWQSSLTVGVGFTDNIANTPPLEEGAPEGAVGPQADAFATLNPGIGFLFETPSITHELAYAFGLNLYFRFLEATAYSNSLSYGLRAPVGEATELMAGVSGSQSTLSVFNLAGPARSTPVDASGGGDTVLLTATASQGLRHEINPSWSFGQGLSATAARTLVPDADDLESYVLSGTLGLSYALSEGEIGASVSNDTMIIPRGGGIGAEDATRIQNVHTAQLSWRHPWTDDWSTSISAGALVAYTADDPGDMFAHPAGSASVDYLTDRGSAQLAYSHGAAPNLLLGLITLADAVTLRGGIPIGGTGFDLAGSVGYVATRPFLADGFGPPGHGVLGDAAVGWISQHAPLRLELRYQIVRQFAPELEPGQSAVAAGIPALERQTVLFTATFAYPNPPTIGGGGAGALVTVSSPTSDPDTLRTNAPQTERERDEIERREKDEADERRERLGGDGK
jgi:hypothetical protein